MTSPTGSVEGIDDFLKKWIPDYCADLVKKDVESIVASEVRKARLMPKIIESSSDIRLGNSRPLRERELIMRGYNRCWYDVQALAEHERIAELEREEHEDS